MRSLPRHLPILTEKSQRGSVNFTSKMLVPKLIEMYGSLDHFFESLIRTKDGDLLLKQQLAKMLSVVTDKQEKLLEEARYLGQLQAVQAIQERYNLVALDLQQGCRTSKNGYNKMHRMLSYESREQALKRVAEQGIQRTPL